MIKVMFTENKNFSILFRSFFSKAPTPKKVIDDSEAIKEEEQKSETRYIF